jgi:hypothetical protein
MGESGFRIDADNVGSQGVFSPVRLGVFTS